jgi:CRISPR-associated exonuclease Cas4
MTNVSDTEMIPISALGALEYCPRSFYYQVVQGELPVNEFMLEGQLARQRLSQAERTEGAIETRRLYLFSEALHLTGFVEVTQERAGTLRPVEYKYGQQGQWPGDHLQLCAQALCLEERQPGKPPIAYGYISFVESQRRVKVPFTPPLRARTKAATREALRVAARETPPPPLTGKLAARCPSCSLFSLCLPEEVRLLQVKKSR